MIKRKRKITFFALLLCKLLKKGTVNEFTASVAFSDMIDFAWIFSNRFMYLIIKKRKITVAHSSVCSLTVLSTQFIQICKSFPLFVVVYQSLKCRPPCKPVKATLKRNALRPLNITKRTDRCESTLSTAVFLHLPTSCSNTNSVLPTQEASAAGCSTEAFLCFFPAGYN